MNTSLYITEANHVDSITNVFYTSNLLYLALVPSQLRDPVGKRGHMSISKLFRIYLLWHCFKGGMCGVSLLGENAQKGGGWWGGRVKRTYEVKLTRLQIRSVSLVNSLQPCEVFQNRGHFFGTDPFSNKQAKTKLPAPPPKTTTHTKHTHTKQQQHKTTTTTTNYLKTTT